MVRHLDASQPVALTDNLWLLQQHPNPAAPRCLPCRAAEAASASGLTEAAARNDEGRHWMDPPSTVSSGTGGPAGAAAAAGSDVGQRWADPPSSALQASSAQGVDADAESKDHDESDKSDESDGSDESDESDKSEPRRHRRRQLVTIRVPPSLAGYVPPAACPSCTPEAACAPLLGTSEIPVLSESKSPALGANTNKAPPSGAHSMAEDQRAGTVVSAGGGGGGGAEGWQKGEGMRGTRRRAAMWGG